MIGVFLPYLKKFQRSAESNDIVDRLSYQYSAMLLGISAVMMAASQYLGTPIQCWVPAQFTRMWEKYAETYCFIKGTYFLPNDTLSETYFVDKDENHIGYYQWIPIAMFFQAFMFYAPSVIWRMFNESCELKIKEFAAASEAARKTKQTFSNDKVMATRFGRYFYKKLAFRGQAEVFKKKSTFVSSGHFLPLLFIITKILYLFNIVAQFYVLYAFLNTKSVFWGFDTFMDIYNGMEWETNGLFPRVTMCDFAVMQLNAVHHHTIQCVIVINMLAEKVYIFFWFWLLFAGVCTFISLAYWTISYLTQMGRSFIFGYLAGTPLFEDEEEKNSDLAERFVDKFLTADGVFICQLIQSNSGDYYITVMLQEMFSLFKADEEEKRRRDNEEPSAPALPEPTKAVSEHLTSEDEDDVDSPDTTATLPR
ncbi:unnamed protein product [Caenorhabditis bovis]|uniref:Innexin n=1 Tax=Caenorhabditis bovis TaxID=2654633 RepID=A0A8S1EHI7_9PELO|nr:unnamed protein product [Caenorhabditis bovis]